MSLIIVAGPAGAGKTAFASCLHEACDTPVIHTDDFLHLPRDKRPDATIRAVCDEAIMTHGSAILEGCEALRAVCKTSIRGTIVVYWIECHQPKAECGGLTTQQERYLNQLRKERPDVPIYRVTNY